MLDDDLLDDDNLMEDSPWPLEDLNSAVQDDESSNLNCRSPVKEESPCMPAARAFRLDHSNMLSQKEKGQRTTQTEKVGDNEEEKKEVTDGANDDSQGFEEEMGTVIQEADTW